MQAPVFFSIVSANYLAYARTLMGSVRAHHPDARRYVILADEDPGDLGLDPGLFTLVPARELPIPHVEHMALRYSILELNTAVKPYAFEWLAARHPDQAIVYLDPDILVLAPLDEVTSALDDGALAVVTPHLTAPLDDGRHPDELAIMRAGAYNLGFIAMGPHPGRPGLAAWWARHLEFGALVDFEAGTFTDQKWVELVPGMFPDVRILRHPGYNLAYWNLAHRVIATADDGSLLANDEPVSFVHFSGVDPVNPGAFSKHQDRFDAHAIGELRPTYLRYLDLVRANDHARYSRIPYAYGRLRDGTAITEAMRAEFRDHYDIGAPSERRDPFGLRAADFGGRHLAGLTPRTALWRLYAGDRGRGPLRPVADRLLPKGSARRERVKALARPAAATAPAAAAPTLARTRPIRWGDPLPLRANLVGYLTGEFGVAEAGRLIAESAIGAGIDLALVRVEAGGKREDDRRLASLIGSSAPHPVTLVCVNADQTPAVLGSLGPDVTDGHYIIGYWHWELSRFPRAWSHAIDLVDEIWTASEFVARAALSATRKRVRVVPLPVDVRLARPYTRAEFGLPEDRFVFLFTLDFHSFLARKNPAGLVAAFRTAFPPGDERVALVIKTTNGHDRPTDVGLLRDAIGGDERIQLRDGYLSRGDVFGLESVADAYVSLHRSEGFGLGLAESMFLGKPVIATAYSGNLEFMTPANSCLVGYRLVDVGDGEYPHPEGQVWADPDLAHAADLMRRLVDDPDHAASLGRRAAADVRELLSPARTGARIARALHDIHAAHAQRDVAPTGAATTRR